MSVMGHVKYGKGKGYNPEAHEGSGKRQKLTPPAVGNGYNRPTPGAMQAVVGPPEGAGHGKKGKGYNTEAHTDAHHGPFGEAMGKKGDHQPNCYDQALHGEGCGALDGHGGPNFLQNHNHGTMNKAEHHPRMGEPHHFKKPMTDGVHGYGHSGTQRQGFLRTSGHSNGHRIGKR